MAATTRTPTDPRHRDEHDRTAGGRSRPGPWLARLAPARARGEVSLAFVTDARIRALNRAYRGADEPTDVLSFPADPVAPPGGRRARGHRHCRRRGARARRARRATRSAPRRACSRCTACCTCSATTTTPTRARWRQVEHRLRRRGGLREGLIARARRERPMTALWLVILAAVAFYLGTVGAAFASLMRLSLRLVAERTGRSGAPGRVPRRSRPAVPARARGARPRARAADDVPCS